MNLWCHVATLATIFLPALTHSGEMVPGGNVLQKPDDIQQDLPSVAFAVSPKPSSGRRP
jgi:hypothetical protein